MPPNCKFEVDDVLKPWQFQKGGRSDLIHMRDMLFGTFTPEQRRLVYKQAYNILAPGGWIEQMETGIMGCCDDGSTPPDCLLTDNWGKMLYPVFAQMGKEMDTIDHFKSRIEAAGFINVHEKYYKAPLGDWPKNPVMKEAGSFGKTPILEGLEGT